MADRPPVERLLTWGGDPDSGLDISGGRQVSKELWGDVPGGRVIWLEQAHWYLVIPEGQAEEFLERLTALVRGTA